MPAPEARNGTVIERVVTRVVLESEKAGFAHVQQAVRVERTVTNKRSGKVERGTRTFVTSLSPAEAGPAKLGTLVRGHWTVENNIHWLRDAVCKEDACRARNPNIACGLALLRTALLAPVRKAGYTSLQQTIEIMARHPAKALNLVLHQRLDGP